MTFVDVSRRVRRGRLLRNQTWLWALVRVPYRRVLRSLSKVRGIDRKIDGETFRWRYPFSELDQDFERPVLEIFRDIVKPGSVVLDIGASYGLYSIVAGRRVGEKGKVFAFEPSSVADVLIDHLSLNLVAERVDVLRLVVSDQVGETPFFEADDTMLASLSLDAASRGEHNGSTTFERLRRTTTVDTFIREQGIRPDVLKVDVEGAEAAVLRGAESFLRERRGRIVLEVHPWALSTFGDTHESVLEQLQAYGWAPRHVYSRGEVDDPASTVHYICEPLARTAGSETCAE